MFNLLNIFKTTKSKKSKKTKKSKNTTKKISNIANKVSNKELCSKKYLGKSVRGTPKNWAYNRCIKRNKWESCKTLPPAGYGMHRYFCE